MSSEKSIFFIFFLYFYDPATSAIVVLILEDFLKVVVSVCQYVLNVYDGEGSLSDYFPLCTEHRSIVRIVDYSHW